MPLNSRLYKGKEDLEFVFRLVDSFPENSSRVNDLPYRLISPIIDDPRNLVIWEDEQRNPVGFSSTVFYWAALEYSFIPEYYQEGRALMLDWATSRVVEMNRENNTDWNGAVDVREGDIIMQELVEKEGFRPSENYKLYYCTRDLTTDIPLAKLPDGYSVRSLAGRAEVEEAVAVHRAAFGTENMTVAWRERILGTHRYNSDLDLVAVGPDGNLVGVALCWLNFVANPLKAPTSVELSGQFEPVGVRPELQRSGIGRALLYEGMRRLKSLGVTTAIVETTNAFEGARQTYVSVGFEATNRFHKYYKFL